jgi:hypothetical protein
MAAKNPILYDTEITVHFAALSPEARAELHAFTWWLYRYAARKAEECWQEKKAPMAVYWAAVKGWSFHLSRVMGNGKAPPDELKELDALEGMEQGF